MLSYMSKNSTRVVVWWFLVLAGALVALLVAWAARVVHVPAVTLLTVAAVVVALSWLVVLVTVPWNLYFAARRAAQEMAVSRDRGITVRRIGVCAETRNARASARRSRDDSRRWSDASSQPSAQRAATTAMTKRS